MLAVQGMQLGEIWGSKDGAFFALVGGGFALEQEHREQALCLSFLLTAVVLGHVFVAPQDFSEVPFRLRSVIEEAVMLFVSQRETIPL